MAPTLEAAVVVYFHSPSPDGLVMKLFLGSLTKNVPIT